VVPAGASQVAVEWQQLHQYTQAQLDQVSDDQTGECTAKHTVMYEMVYRYLYLPFI